MGSTTGMGVWEQHPDAAVEPLQLVPISNGTVISYDTIVVL
jgi:hypothetical protein